MPTKLISNETKSKRLSSWLADKGKSPPQPTSTMKTKTPQEKPEFHLGQLLKAELARQGRTATWLAKQVHCTPENIYKAYRSQWISMPLLFEICKALDYDFFKDCSAYLEAEKTN